MIGKSSTLQWRFALASLAFILLVAFGLYSSAFDNEFTHWDDNYYVTDNARIRDVSPSGILKIFNPWDIIEAEGDILTEYLPVTTLTHAIIYHYRGLDARAYHSVVVWLYLLDIVLLCVLLNMVLKDWLVAALACLAPYTLATWRAWHG